MQVNQRQFRTIDVFAFTFCSTITLGVAFLPFVANEEIRSAWLKLIVGVIPYFFLLWLIHRFTLKYSDHDFFGALKGQLWRGLYWVIMLYYLFSSLFAVSRGVNDLHVLMRTYLLNNSPKWLIVVSFLVVVGIAVYYGIQAITRFVVLFVTLEALMVLFVFFLGFGEAFNVVFLFPIWSTDLLTFLRSTLSDMARYAGVIALLGFIFYVKKSEKILKPMNLALALVMILYVAISIVVVGTFGFEQSVRLISPATALTQTITTQAGLAERVDLFFLGFWIVSFFKIAAIHLWFVIFLARKCWPKVHNSILIITCSSIIFLYNIFIPTSLMHGYRLHNTNAMVYSLLLPCCLLLYLLVNNRNHNKGVNQHG
jgi:spore germination protein AB